VRDGRPISCLKHTHKQNLPSFLFQKNKSYLTWRAQTFFFPSFFTFHLTSYLKSSSWSYSSPNGGDHAVKPPSQSDGISSSERLNWHLMSCTKGNHSTQLHPSAALFQAQQDPRSSLPSRRVGCLRFKHRLARGFHLQARAQQQQHWRCVWNEGFAESVFPLFLRTPDLTYFIL